MAGLREQLRAKDEEKQSQTQSLAAMGAVSQASSQRLSTAEKVSQRASEPASESNERPVFHVTVPQQRQAAAVDVVNILRKVFVLSFFRADVLYSIDSWCRVVSDSKQPGAGGVIVVWLSGFVSWGRACDFATSKHIRRHCARNNPQPTHYSNHRVSTTQTPGKTGAAALLTTESSLGSQSDPTAPATTSSIRTKAVPFVRPVEVLSLRLRACRPTFGFWASSYIVPCIVFAAVLSFVFFVCMYIRCPTVCSCAGRAGAGEDPRGVVREEGRPGQVVGGDEGAQEEPQRAAGRERRE